MTDTNLTAIKAALRRGLLKGFYGIEQVDAVVCEDGETVMLYGHTADPDVTYVATFPIPAVEWHKA
jgi:hypothetical protein